MTAIRSQGYQLRGTLYLDLCPGIVSVATLYLSIRLVVILGISNIFVILYIVQLLIQTL